MIEIYDDFFEVTFLRPSYYDKNYGTYDLSQNKVNRTQKKLTTIQSNILYLIRDDPNITQKDMAEN